MWGVLQKISVHKTETSLGTQDPSNFMILQLGVSYSKYLAQDRAYSMLSGNLMIHYCQTSEIPLGCPTDNQFYLTSRSPFLLHIDTSLSVRSLFPSKQAGRSGI